MEKPKDKNKKNVEESILRFLTCGAVDDGKSTLIGRILYDSQLIYDDHLSSLKAESTKINRTEGKEEIDLSLLVDGLQEEKEQGITIDVAYRFFTTKKRRFIVADCPGHIQYTRNMATGASNVDLGLVLIDASKGVTEQTRRHAYILATMGIEHIALCVNKIDLVNYDKTIFDEIKKDFTEFLLNQNITTIKLQAIPVSALKGDNIVKKSQKTDWYKGPVLIDFLEEVDISKNNNDLFSFPVQFVNRPNSSFRGYLGMVASGNIKTGDPIMVLPSGQKNIVKEVYDGDKQVKLAKEGMSPCLTLEKETDISRGDVLVHPDFKFEHSNIINCKIISLAENKLYTSRRFVFQFKHKKIMGVISRIKNTTDFNSFAKKSAKHLDINEFGECEVLLDESIIINSYNKNKELGSFIIIDHLSKDTIAAGMVNFSLDRSQNIFPSETNLKKEQYSEIKHQNPCVLWLTGLSGAGKTTIANTLESRLFSMGYHTYLLDGDGLRKGINADLGFTKEDRIENIRRVGEISRILVDAGLIVIVSVISPYREDRDAIRQKFNKNEFVEIWVNTTFEECMKRDPKGLYKKFIQGNIRNFTGATSDYEHPLNPEINLDTMSNSPERSADIIVKTVQKLQKKCDKHG